MVSNNVIIWLCVQISLIHQFSRIIILKFLVEMLLISLQYLLLFLLKEQTVFLLASSLTRNLVFKVSSPVNISFISNDLEH